MALVHVLTTPGTVASSTSLTIASHVVSGADPVLVVVVSYKGAATVTGITWNGTENLVQVGTTAQTGSANAELWVLKAPTATTASVVISFSAAADVVGAAMTYSGVHQTNPFVTSAAATNTGTNAAPTVNVVALDRQMVVDSLSQVANGPPTAIGDHLERHDAAQANAGTDTRGASQEKLSAGATETMGWTMSATGDWGIVAAPLQSPFITQEAKDALALDTTPFVKTAEIIKNPMRADTRVVKDITERIVSWGKYRGTANIADTDWERPNLQMKVENADAFFSKHHAKSWFNEAPAVDPRDTHVLIKIYVAVDKSKRLDLIRRYRGRVLDVHLSLTDVGQTAVIKTIMAQDRGLDVAMSKRIGGRDTVAADAWF